MLKGGYKIVDFKDTNISSESGTTIVGIYNEIEGSHRKAILISGVTIDNVEYRDCFVDCESSENSFTFSAHGKTFTVTNEDKVTIA